MRLGRGAIDFIGQQKVRENGAGAKDHLAASARDFLEDVRAEDVARHQVRRKLNAVEAETEQLAQGLDECGFADTGEPFEEDVAAAEDANKYEAMEVGAAEQHRIELFEQAGGQIGGRLEFLRFEQRTGLRGSLIEGLLLAGSFEIAADGSLVLG